MTQLEQIKKEIERRIGLIEVSAIRVSEMNKMVHAFRSLLSFIESLEKEQEYTDYDIDGLEKQLDMWRHKHFKGARDAYFAGEWLERGAQLEIAKQFYKLGKTQSDMTEQEFKIKGWVARERAGVCPNLCLYEDKPEREDNGYGDLFWHSRAWTNSIRLKSEMFPELKWEDEPIEVELIINRL